MTIPNISSSITYIRFQEFKHEDNAQYLAFGEKNDGTIFLYRLPPNLKNQQGDELKIMDEFWEREINKCLYQKDRKVTRVEEKDEEEKRRSIEEAKKADENINVDENAIREAELAEEQIYQTLLMETKFNFELITETEWNGYKDELKKK
jgi:hypothetical protein